MMLEFQSRIQTVETQAFHFLHDILHTAWRALMAVFIAAPLAALLAAGITEITAAIITHRFFGSVAANAYALGIALVVGYAVALTSLVIECLRGATAVAKWIRNELSEEIDPPRHPQQAPLPSVEQPTRR